LHADPTCREDGARTSPRGLAISWPFLPAAAGPFETRDPRRVHCRRFPETALFHRISTNIVQSCLFVTSRQPFLAFACVADQHTSQRPAEPPEAGLLWAGTSAPGPSTSALGGARG